MGTIIQAIKFSPDIFLSTVINVDEQGHGISPQQKKRVFIIFFNNDRLP